MNKKHLALIALLTEALKRRDAENAELRQQLNEIKTVLSKLAEKRGN